MRVVALSAFLVLAGCTETEYRSGPPRTPGSDGGPVDRTSREKNLLDRVEEDPKDSKRWFELGDYYERGGELAKAADCYERGHALLEPGKWTGGHFLLARVYARMDEFQRAMAHLDAIIEMEPRDVKTAVLNPHFRDGHYLRGAIFYTHKQWRDARKEFIRFVELGGDEGRVEEWLETIRRETGE